MSYDLSLFENESYIDKDKRINILTISIFLFKILKSLLGNRSIKKLV